jgi:hypothetical protein
MLVFGLRDQFDGLMAGVLDPMIHLGFDNRQRQGAVAVRRQRITGEVRDHGLLERVGYPNRERQAWRSFKSIVSPRTLT